ncbi:hypothetical protein RQC66_21600 [Streptomyces justiciae]|uniref:NAD-dependent epimerase/dehydratase domain-containing protein n=1 Tax=Streptomyces justiciae TaxID=2780140 RepID=A0ABU3LVQ9_9ACTN|nr:hypothetical protein [Streptomyces justiciae]
MLAERAAWDYTRTHRDIELAVINPTGIFGPQPGIRPSASVGLVKAMLTGQMPVVPVMYFGVVDVRDVVDLHLRGLPSTELTIEQVLEAAKTQPALRDAAVLQGRIPVISNKRPVRYWAGSPGASPTRSWRRPMTSSEMACPGPPATERPHTALTSVTGGHADDGLGGVHGRVALRSRLTRSLRTPAHFATVRNRPTRR